MPSQSPAFLIQRTPALALLAALGTGAAAFFGTEAPPEGLLLASAAGVAVFGLGIGLAAWLGARGLERRTEKASADIDAVARRLVRLEADLAELGRRDAAPLHVPAEELAAEVGLLGGLVRDIALAMAAHDRDIGALKAGRDGRPAADQEADKAGLATGPDEASPARRLGRDGLREGARGTVLEREAGAGGSGAPGVLLATRAALPAREDPPLRDPAWTGPNEAAILQAFDGGQGLELFLQGIVSLPQRKLRLYEASPRLRLPADEEPLPPEAFTPLLERHGRLPDLDRTILARSAVVARHLHARGSEALVACALSGESVRHPGFLRAIAQFVEAHPDLRGRLVLALPHAVWRGLDQEGAGALAAIRARGLALMLDRVEDPAGEAAALAAGGIAYLKLTTRNLSRFVAARDEGRDGADILADLRGAGLALVVAGVQDEAAVPDLIELGVPLAQGNVFAPARAVRAEALQAPPAPKAPQAHAEGGAEPQTAEAPTPERKPFRAFLRRAG